MRLAALQKRCTEPLQVSWCAAIHMVLRDKRVSRQTPCSARRRRRARRAGTTWTALQSIDNENLLDDGETDTVGRRNKRPLQWARSKRRDALAEAGGADPSVRHACADTGALLLNDGTILYRSGRWLISQPIEAQERNGSGSTTLTRRLRQRQPRQSRGAGGGRCDGDKTDLRARARRSRRQADRMLRLRQRQVSRALRAACWRWRWWWRRRRRRRRRRPSAGAPGVAAMQAAARRRRERRAQVRILPLQSRRVVCTLNAALDAPLIGCSFSSDARHILAYSARRGTWPSCGSGRRSGRWGCTARGRRSRACASTRGSALSSRSTRRSASRASTTRATSRRSR